MLNKMSMRRNRKGFTLIELMIVVAIIGILAAIAIPQFAAYRQRAYDSAAKSALHNLATAQENYYSAHDAYVTGADVAAVNAAFTEMQVKAADFAAPGSLTTTAIAGPPAYFTATAQHKSSTTTFTWNSSAGGLQ